MKPMSIAFFFLLNKGKFVIRNLTALTYRDSIGDIFNFSHFELFP
jgi:hypothetical protein